MSGQPGTASVEDQIRGDYQLRALEHGWAFQRAWHDARLELVAQVLPPAASDLIVDAACGSGIVTYRFAASQARIVSLDRRVSACEVVRAHTPGARAAAGDLTALPFQSGVFSRLYLLEAIEHVTSDVGATVLTELLRVAAAGAHCLVTTPNYRSYWPVLEWMLDTTQLTPPMRNGQHQSRYTRSTLRRALEAAGWRVEAIGSFNLFAPIAGLLSRGAARRCLAFEREHLGDAGAILYAVCVKPR